MNENIIKLSELPIGKKATVIKIHSKDFSKQRLLDLGLVDGTIVKTLRKSVFGDPTAFLIRGSCIALRYEESKNIEVILWD